MNEPANDPPLVTRVPEVPAAPPRPRPGLGEAVVWCAAFVAVQFCALFGTLGLVFTAHILAAPQPGAFFDRQLDDFSKAVDPKAQADPPPLPHELGQSIAYGMLAAQFASLGVVALVVPRRVGPEWRRQLGFRAPHGLHVALVVALVPGFIIVSSVIQEAFLWATGIQTPAARGVIRDVFKPFPVPLTALAVAIGPGVVEELWCRAFLGRGLCARYGLFAGALLTSGLFALMHIDPSQLLVIALMGGYLHFVYVATRSVWPPILLHALNNGVSVLLMLTLETERAAKVPFVVTLAAVALMTFATVALWTGRAVPEPTGGGPPGGEWKPEYPGVSAPPPGAGVRLAYEAASPAAVAFTFCSFAAVMYLTYRFVI